ncbi:MAG: NUDIX hydrolase [Clostridia bacterium]|nr:NUDIX hydrolase [Clostridia bacterium]
MAENKKNLYESFKEIQVGREEIFDGVIVHLVRDTVIIPNGSRATREVCLHHGAVCIVPITDEGEIVMERQFRYPFGKVLWEIPAGKLDKDEFDHLEAAKRELREETGYTAENFTFIGEYYPSPAILSESIHMYVATGLKKGEQDLDEDEFLDVSKIPFDDVVKMILNNEITDGKTQAAVLKAKLLLGK